MSYRSITQIAANENMDYSSTIRKHVRSALPKLGPERVRRAMKSFDNFPNWHNCFCALAYGEPEELLKDMQEKHKDKYENYLSMELDTEHFFDFVGEELGLTRAEVMALSEAHFLTRCDLSLTRLDRILPEECDAYLETIKATIDEVAEVVDVASVAA